MCNLKNPLVRYGSEPLVMDDEIDKNSSQESVSDLNADSAPAFPLSLSLSGRESSMTLMSSLTEEEEMDDAKYHRILMKNIKLWKQSKKVIHPSRSSSSDVNSEIK